MFTNATGSLTNRLTATRRAALGRAGVLAAVSCLTIGLAVAEPLATTAPHVEAKGKGKGGKVVTRTFSSPQAVVINDNTTADPYPSTIVVSGFKKGVVTDVNVTLRGYNHSYPDNVDVMLMAPNGASTILMTDAGGVTDASSLTITLDDEAATQLPDATALQSGSFIPSSYGVIDTFPTVPTPPSVNLSVLDGGNPNGEWRLYVVDDAAGNVGAFSGGWDLEITAKLKKKKHHGKH
ncbi:MAG: hypothetical protein QM692_15025 [Thermomicrobiales bacterium]